MYADYLDETDGGSSDPPVFVTTGRTTTDVNLRSGPSNGHQVLRVLPKGATLRISDRLEYGHRYVEHEGLAGWAWDEYVTDWSQGPGAGYVVATSDVNLRAQPNTGSKVLRVIPKGARRGRATRSPTSSAG